MIIKLLEVDFMYQAFIVDRLNSLKTRKTAKYLSWLGAYNAAKKIEKKYFTGMRANINVIKLEVTNGNG